jgi:hypothetical protein
MFILQILSPERLGTIAVLVVMVQIQQILCVAQAWIVIITRVSGMFLQSVLVSQKVIVQVMLPV